MVFEKIKLKNHSITFYIIQINFWYYITGQPFAFKYKIHKYKTSRSYAFIN